MDMLLYRFDDIFGVTTVDICTSWSIIRAHLYLTVTVAIYRFNHEWMLHAIMVKLLTSPQVRMYTQLAGYIFMIKTIQKYK